MVPGSPSPNFSLNTSSEFNWNPVSRKAAIGAAFHWVPVLLALLFSSLIITFLLNIQPAGAASSKTYFQTEDQTYQVEYFPTDATYQERRISPVFTREVLYWEDKIVEWADMHQLDPNFVAIVMQIESCGHPNIRSQVGANGLFQVMPFHFNTDENPVDPATNALRGLKYLARSLQLAKSDPELALAGYNGGHSVIQLNPTYWANETQRYVYWGSGILSDISSGNTTSPRLNEWLDAGGISLCKQAADALGF